MCICDLKHNEEKHLKDGDYNTLYIEKEYWTYYIKAEADGCVRFPILYCPICGRNLDDENGSDD